MEKEKKKVLRRKLRRRRRRRVELWKKVEVSDGVERNIYIYMCIKVED